MFFCRRILLAGIMLIFMENAAAITMLPPPKATTPVWFVLGSLGYTKYQDMYADDGETSFGRFAIGRELFIYRQCAMGIEMGFQTGDTARLAATESQMDALGGSPIQFIIKPMVDLLAVVKIALGNTLFSFQVKGGGAYRQWQYEGGNSVNDLNQIGGEVQAGFGYQISQRASLAVLYQGIFGENPNFTVDEVSNTGHVSNISAQNGVLLTLSVAI